MRVLKFGAVWCSGCLIMKPLWNEIESENAWLKTEYFDFDVDKEMVTKYGVDDRLPTFIFLDKDGNELERITGEYSKKELMGKIVKYKSR